MSRSLAFILLASGWIMEGQAVAPSYAADESRGGRGAAASLTRDMADAASAHTGASEPSLWAALLARWGGLGPVAALPPAIEPANDYTG